MNRKEKVPSTLLWPLAFIRVILGWEASSDAEVVIVFIALSVTGVVSQNEGVSPMPNLRIGSLERKEKKRKTERIMEKKVHS